MLQEISTQLFTLTPAATDAVKNILEQRNLEGYALRVYVAGGGCCGVNFGMALDNNFRDVDTTFEANGVKVVVDEVSIDYLREATVDFVNDPTRGAGFAVDSPHAKKNIAMAKAAVHVAQMQAVNLLALVVAAHAVVTTKENM
ncbi:MAG: iron-sulfur cluster assembly accessory protein [Anaerolineales bacterium]|nr:iron-sulfur cluster assembly accessory protein [Anaerolineales bacterium]